MLRALALVVLLGSPGAPGEPTQVELKQSGSGWQVEGRFDVADPAGKTTWDVLTDYDHLQELVPGMRNSRVEHRGSADVIVAQDATAKVLFVSRDVHLLLDVRERPPDRIAFRDLSHRDFTVYEGSWTLTVSGGTTRVAYSLHVQPREQAPGFLASGALRSSVRDLLDHLRAEIARRCPKQPRTQR